RHIEFVLLAPRRVLAVLIADTGKVEQGVVDVGSDVTDEDLTALRARFLGSIAGSQLDLLPQVLPSVVALSPPSLRGLASGLAHGLERLADRTRDERIVMAGTANLARS